MTVRVYRSTDTSAPVLTGSVGTLTALLDAILVNGYGSQTAAGWTISQTTTNKRSYKQNLTGSNNTSGMHLYVDDTGPGAGAAREARVCGFETISAITPTGTGQFPTASQSLIGTGQLVIRKSITADAVARAWTCIANGQTIYLFIESADSGIPLATTTFCFGDFKSYKTSDQYAVCILGRTVENTGSSNCDPLSVISVASAGAGPSLNDGILGHYIARHWTGVGGSIRAGKPSQASMFCTSTYNNTATNVQGPFVSATNLTAQNNVNVSMGRQSTTYTWPAPNGPDGAIWLQPVYLNHSWAIRGYLTGLWAPLHDRPLGHADTFTIAAGSLSGKSMIAQNIQAYVFSSANSDNGQVVIETSDTWS